MLIKPSIDSLLNKVESKYTLVIAASKRGRRIRDIQNKKKSEEKYANTNTEMKLKEVSIALEEIEDGLVNYSYQETEEIELDSNEEFVEYNKELEELAAEQPE